MTELCKVSSPQSAVQGKALTATVRGIHAEFAAAAEALQKAAYDPLDMSVAQFDDDHTHFCEVTAELERRLSAIITQVHALGTVCNAAGAC